MKAATLIFPHQLFKQNPAADKSRPVYLIEEWLFFRQYPFHQQKLLLHRASMKSYEAFLLKNKIAVNYVDSMDKESDVQHLIAALSKNGVQDIHYTDTADNWLEKRIIDSSKKAEIVLVKYPSPNFLNITEDTGDFFSKKKTYFQTDFYISQRKQRKILVEADGKPVGGKWTFDTENRLKFAKNETVPAIKFPKENSYVQEATRYIHKHFKNNYGHAEQFIYPTNFADAEKWLDDFLTTRLAKFGKYEDAMVKNEHFLYHSVLTPILNIGLLNPQQIIDKTFQAAVQYDIPLNSLEGFIRQITGWREFIRLVYEREGSKQRTKNFWKFSRKIPLSFWTGSTGIYPG